MDVQYILYIVHCTVCSLYISKQELCTEASAEALGVKYALFEKFPNDTIGYCLDLWRIFDHCPRFYWSLRHIELCNNVICLIHRNPPKHCIIGGCCCCWMQIDLAHFTSDCYSLVSSHVSFCFWFREGPTKELNKIFITEGPASDNIYSAFEKLCKKVI